MQKYFSLGLAFLYAIPQTHAFSCGYACHSPQSNECTIVVQDILRLDNDGNDISFECVLDPLDADGSANVSVPLRISDEQREILTNMFHNGDFVSDTSALILDKAMQISFEGVFIPSQRTTFEFNRMVDNGARRHLSRTEGDKPYLVVKVTDSEGRKRGESTDQISDDIFGTYGDQMTLKSQMEACSYGKLGVVAGVGDQHEVSPGVIEVTIDKSLVGNSSWVIRSAVTREVQLLLGHTLPGPYAHVMYVLEGCYLDCGWVAYAYVNSWLSVYQGHYYKAVGVQMHGEFQSSIPNALKLLLTYLPLSAIQKLVIISTLLTPAGLMEKLTPTILDSWGTLSTRMTSVRCVSMLQRAGSSGGMMIVRL